MKKYLILTLILVSVTVQAGDSTDRPDDSALVIAVNVNNELGDVSSEDLNRLFLGRTSQLPGLRDPILFVYQVASERFFRSGPKMSPLQFRRHWMRLIFSGEFVNPPSELPHLDELLRRVKNNPSAIAVIYYCDLTDALKYLTIDSLDPKADEYPLK